MKLYKIITASCLVLSQAAFAHGPVAVPLIGAPLPPVPGLTDGNDPIVVNPDMAIALGKALFWDMNIGSDGMACASCHFHAGADNRVKNQINPGTLSPHPDGQTFETLPFGDGGPNYTLHKDDFPLFQFLNPLDKQSAILTSSNDMITSGGTFSGTFTGVSSFTGMDDDCNRSADPVFNVNGVGTRRVEPRNAPTVINSVFNHRNFWDGRANNIFNGSSNWGDRDKSAGVWVQVNRRKVKKQALHLENSSLASQAVATAMSQLEMTCSNRSIADIGRKVLMREPLQHQKVHTNDSVFGPLSLNKPLNSNGELQAGLSTTYKNMIRASFARKYWGYTRRGKFGAPASGGVAYNQMEINFPMFFGLAIQMYESTLVSDQAPIDTTTRDTEYYYPNDLNESELRGFHLFRASHCNACHAGPTLTSAAITTNSAIVTPTPGKFYGPNHSLRAFGPNAMGKVGTDGAEDIGIKPEGNVVTRSATDPLHETIHYSRLSDFGFFNTTVADSSDDPGLGGVDDDGRPLSFSAQYVQYLLGNYQNVMDSPVFNVYACQFESAMSWAISFSFGNQFNIPDGIELDGSRPGESGLRNTNCKNPLYAYIPEIDSALTASQDPADTKMLLGVHGSFKAPTLRNIELTGPYMHNGSMSTLEQVIEFYARAGNTIDSNAHEFMTLTSINDGENDEQDRADLVAFLKTLTDERVRYEQAPFDHPELVIPNGHEGDHLFANAGNSLEASLAKQEFITIPAVGVNGRPTPLQPFDTFLDQ